MEYDSEMMIMNCSSSIWLFYQLCVKAMELRHLQLLCSGDLATYLKNLCSLTIAQLNLSIVRAMHSCFQNENLSIFLFNESKSFFFLLFFLKIKAKQKNNPPPNLEKTCLHALL